MDIHVHRIWSEEAYSTGVVARGYTKNGDYPRWTEKVKIQDLGTNMFVLSCVYFRCLGC